MKRVRLIQGLLVALFIAIAVACGGSGKDKVGAQTAQAALIAPTAYNGYLPKAECAPGDLVETGLQGQVPMADRLSGRSALGYECNLALIGHFASASFANMDSYKNCVYYSDNRGGNGSLTGQGGPADGGGVVLDVSDPTHPVKTAYLDAWAMKNAGESLRVNHKRGLLVADYYDLSKMSAGSLAVYDISKDCAHPVLLANIKTMPRAVGHEGCFSPDGMTYWMASMGTITPIDLTDPANPKEITAPWAMTIHGCAISDDGNRGYFSDIGNFPVIGNQGLSIVDTSSVQSRTATGPGNIVAKFDTSVDNPVQQSSYYITYDGKPYVFNWSEAGAGFQKTDTCGTGAPANFGFARILDISDENHPKEVSQLKMEVHDPANCAIFKTDRGPQISGHAQGDTFWSVGAALFLYDTHYCRPDRLHNPTVMGCASFGSGLRIWDIQDPRHPKEIAYYNTGTVQTAVGPVLDFAVAPPVFRRDLGQVWWVTLYGGFHAAKFREGIWPSKKEQKCVNGYDYFADQYDPTYCHSTWNK